MFSKSLFGIIALALFWPPAWAAQPATLIIDAGKLDPNSQYVSRQFDINDDGIQETFNCNYSTTTPPAACGKDDCGYTASSLPVLTCDIAAHDGNTIAISYMCSRISTLGKTHHGMHDLLCNSNVVLQWNGSEYVD